MPPSFDSFGPCLETAGFLFSHPCSRPASTECSRCGKRICDEHTSTLEDGLVCASCYRASDESDSEDSDDPSYYYDDYGYYGSGGWGSGGARDANDFTEADGESLRHEDDASFEEDLGGS